MSDAQKSLNAIISNVEKVILGKRSQIQLILCTWLSGGHVLLEDVPGTGKTMLAKALSRSIDVSMGRVQFTPDLLPSDITGSSIYDQNNHQFKFEKGPIFCSFFLADEINRATPRTQSALLECMGEKQVTVDNNTYQMDDMFFAMATQNPIESHGTFPLPEAQLDRFSIKLALGHMNREQEILMARTHMTNNPIDSIGPVISNENFLAIRKLLPEIRIDDSVYEYVLDIVEGTRKSEFLDFGCSPRATLNLFNIGRAMTLLAGEDFLRPGTIYQIAPYVLAHRMMLSQDAKFSGMNEVSVVDKVLKSIKPPIS